MTTEARRLERERHKTAQADRLWALLSNPLLQSALIGVGGYVAFNQLGRTGSLDKGTANFAASMCPVLAAASLGVSSAPALIAIGALASAAGVESLEEAIASGALAGAFPPYGLLKAWQDAPWKE